MCKKINENYNCVLSEDTSVHTLLAHVEKCILMSKNEFKIVNDKDMFNSIMSALLSANGLGHLKPQWWPISCPVYVSELLTSPFSLYPAVYQATLYDPTPFVAALATSTSKEFMNYENKICSGVSLHVFAGALRRQVAQVTRG